MNDTSIKLTSFIFSCLDIDETEKFYMECFGFHLIRKFEHGKTSYLVLSYKEKPVGGGTSTAGSTATYHDICLRFEASNLSEKKTRFKKAPLRNVSHSERTI